MRVAATNSVVTHIVILNVAEGAGVRMNADYGATGPLGLSLTLGVRIDAAGFGGFFADCFSVFSFAISPLASRTGRS
jgi:hypothetical protein